jgi:hypothetical protein
MLCSALLWVIRVSRFEDDVKHKVLEWLDNAPLTNPVERRQAGVFQWVLIIWLMLASIQFLGSVVAFLFQPTANGAAPSAGPVPPMFPISIALLQLAGTLLLVAPITALVLLRRGRFNLAVMAAAFGLLLGHTIATYILGITNASVLIVFQIPIALAGLLAGRACF